MERNEDTLPKWARRFLSIICPAWLVDEIEGDLIEKYQFDINHYGAFKARRKLMSNILRFFRPGIFLRKRISFNSKQSIMLRNYVVTAVRVSKRQGVYTFINVLGLSIGLAASLLIGVYIADEFSYDKNIKDAERIYRVGVDETFKGDLVRYSGSGTPFAEAMQREVPEVEEVVRVFRQRRAIRVGDNAFMDKEFMSADSNFFKFFGYKVLEGNADECLKGPNKIVLSQSAAKLYLGYDGKGDSPVGKQLVVSNDGKTIAEITGIFQDLPTNTHMKFDVVMSLESLPWVKNGTCWGCYNIKTYFKAIPGADAATIQSKVDRFSADRIIPSIEKDLGVSHDDFVKSGDKVEIFIQPLLSIHLESNLDGEFEPNGDIRYVYILGVAGIFLILIACINFVNLSTARGINRSKEVGVRKTMGATRGGLVPQFMTESLLYAIVSGILALVIAWLGVKPFGELSNKALTLDILGDGYVLTTVVLVIVMVGILAGIYPALHLTSFNPALVLKGNGKTGRSKSAFRNTLVVFQFTLSMVLIIGTLVIYKQLSFLQDHNLGFEKDNILRLRHSYVLGNQSESFKNEVLSHSEFSNASFASDLPPEINGTTFFKVEGSKQLVSVFFFGADADFLKTMGTEMKEGRFFSKEFLSDSAAFVINESAARLLDFKFADQKKIGYSDNEMFHVIGIMKDFNFASLRNEVQPLVMYSYKGAIQQMAIRLGSGNPAPKVELLANIWKKYSGGHALEYSFMDEDFDNTFRSEQRLQKVISLFTGLSVFIASLGLFGLITYIASQRTKEIGIRKVLGASSTQVTYLLLSNLIKLVIISFVISIPLAWYGMEKWLETFAYRTNVDVVSVIIAGAGGLLIAIITVGYRSLKAASANPVDSLKTD